MAGNCTQCGAELRDGIAFCMLGMNGWWGTNGEIYLSLSFADGTVTVDHTYELPDYNFG